MLLPRCCVPIWPNRAVAGAAALFFVAAGVFSAAPVRAAGGSPSEQYVAALRNFPPRPGSRWIWPRRRRTPTAA
jgi:hypothetical protein